MRINWNYMKIILLIISITALYAFTNQRNNLRKVNGITVDFVDDRSLFVTEEMVNKLLIQNYGSLKNVPKEKVVLNTIEAVIETDEMVKKAQVYLTLSGELKSKIEQRQPIGRVEGISKFYLDQEGFPMPLSKVFSARVPIITGKN